MKEPKVHLVGENCGLLPSGKFTLDPKEVTCHRCLEKYKIKPPPVAELFTIRVHNGEDMFRVYVHWKTNESPAFECGWQGGEFKYHGKWYAVMGPYHGLDGSDKFRVYELVPRSKVV